MADHSKPEITSDYLDVISKFHDKIDDVAMALDPANTTPTNLPQYSVRFSSAAKKWQIWSGSAWGDLVGEYAINVSGSAGTLKTARKIGITGGATGTATDFDGSQNIDIPVTALDASKLTGDIAAARMTSGAQTITAGTGLTGGGKLDQGRTLSVDFSVVPKLTGGSDADFDDLPLINGQALSTIFPLLTGGADADFGVMPRVDGSSIVQLGSNAGGSYAIFDGRFLLAAYTLTTAGGGLLNWTFPVAPSSVLYAGAARVTNAPKTYMASPGALFSGNTGIEIHLDSGTTTRLYCFMVGLINP